MYSMFHFSYRLGFYILDGFIDISDVLDYSCYFLSIVIHAYSINLLVCVSACLRKKKKNVKMNSYRHNILEQYASSTAEGNIT